MISRSSHPASMSKGIAAYGRNGDSMLMHVMPEEVAVMNAMVPGGLTINPHTGNPEAFKWWPLLAGVALGGIGSLLFPPLMGALGAGAAGTGAAAAGTGAAAGLGAGALAASPMTAATMAAAPTAAAAMAPAAAPGIGSMLGAAGKGIGAFMGSKWALPAAFMAANVADQYMQPKEGKKKKEEFPQYDFNQQAYYDDSGNFQGFGGGYTYHGMGDYQRSPYQPMYMSDGGQVKVRKDGSSEVTSPSNPYDGMYGDGMMFYPKSLARHPDYRHWLEKALGAQAVGKGIYEWTDMPVPAPGKRSKGMAEGGIVQGAPFNPIEAGIASLVPPGGGASAMRQVDKEIVQQAIMSLTNQIESDEPVNRFIERFGKPALADLAQRIVEAEGQQNSGMMIAGPGDGLSDDIPAAAGRQPIQLSDGEWVIPADVVSSIGNGSTEAGSKQLQNMVRRVRMEKNNSSQQPPSIDPNKILPA